MGVSARSSRAPAGRCCRGDNRIIQGIFVTRGDLIMKLIRHGAPGAEKPGLIAADGTWRDLSGQIADIGPASLGRDSMARLAAIDPATLPLVPAGTRLGPCVGGIGNVVAIGLNYADHAAESGMPVPPEPVVFNKHSGSVSGPNDDIWLPP